MKLLLLVVMMALALDAMCGGRPRWGGTPGSIPIKDDTSPRLPRGPCRPWDSRSVHSCRLTARKVSLTRKIILLK